MFQKVKKIIAAGLTVTYFLTQHASAYPLPAKATPLPPVVVPFRSERGHIQTQWLRGSEGTVYILEDAHTSESAQKNIAALIDAIGAPLVCVEGFDGDLRGRIDTAFTYVAESEKKKVAEHLVRTGEMTGPQFAYALRKKDFVLYGVEQNDDYYANLAQLRGLCAAHSTIMPTLRAYESALAQVKARYYPRDSARLDTLREAAAADAGQSLEYLQALFDCANAFGMTLKKYPHLQQLVQAVGPDDASAIDYGALLEEARRMHAALQKKALRAEARMVFDAEESLRLLGKLFDARLTRAEFQALYDARERFIVQFLFSIEWLSETAEGLRRERSATVREQLEQAFEAGYAFYKQAAIRDKLMVLHTFRQMNTRGIDRAVLVAGGFHTRGITKYLKELNMSYKVIRPTVSASTLPDSEQFQSAAFETSVYPEQAALSFLASKIVLENLFTHAGVRDVERAFTLEVLSLLMREAPGNARGRLHSVQELRGDSFRYSLDMRGDRKVLQLENSRTHKKVNVEMDAEGNLTWGHDLGDPKGSAPPRRTLSPASTHSQIRSRFDDLRYTYGGKYAWLQILEELELPRKIGFSIPQFSSLEAEIVFEIVDALQDQRVVLIERELDEMIRARATASEDTGVEEASVSAYLRALYMSGRSEAEFEALLDSLFAGPLTPLTEIAPREKWMKRMRAWRRLPVQEALASEPEIVQYLSQSEVEDLVLRRLRNAFFSSLLYFALPPDLQTKWKTIEAAIPHACIFRSSTQDEDLFTSSKAGVYASEIANEYSALIKLKQALTRTHTDITEDARISGAELKLFVQDYVPFDRSGVVFSELGEYTTIETAFGEAGLVLSGANNAIIDIPRGSRDVADISYGFYEYPKRIMWQGESFRGEDVQQYLVGLWEDRSTAIETADGIPKPSPLSRAEIDRVVRAARELESALGFPCDIEFGFKDDQFHIVQVRPITARTEGFTAVLNHADAVASMPISIGVTPDEGFAGYLLGEIDAAELDHFSPQTDERAGAGESLAWLLESCGFTRDEVIIVTADPDRFVSEASVFINPEFASRLYHDGVRLREKNAVVGAIPGLFAGACPIEWEDVELTRTDAAGHVHSLTVKKSKTKYRIFSNGIHGVLVEDTLSTDTAAGAPNEARSRVLPVEDLTGTDLRETEVVVDLFPEAMPRDLDEIINTGMRIFQSDPILDIYSFYMLHEDIPIFFVLAEDRILLSEMFARASLFYEVRGYAGTILKNGELGAAIKQHTATRGLDQGYLGQGHDFSAEQLAHFFNKVAHEQIALSDGEERLEAFLVQQGLMHGRRGEYTGLPDRAILGISHDPAMSEIGIRDVVEHELLHGLFSVSAAFRQKVKEYWNTLSPSLQQTIEDWFATQVLIDDSAVRDIYLSEFAAYSSDRFLTLGMTQKGFRDQDALHRAREAVRTISDDVLWDMRHVQPSSRLDDLEIELFYHAVAEESLGSYDAQYVDATVIHVMQTSDLAAALADEIGLSPTAIDEVAYRAKLHDIGKFSDPYLYSLLVQSRVLTAEELDIVRDHAYLSSRVLLERGILTERSALTHIAMHHEWAYRGDAHREIPFPFDSIEYRMFEALILADRIVSYYDDNRQYNNTGLLLMPEKLIKSMKDDLGPRVHEQTWAALARMVSARDPRFYQLLQETVDPTPIRSIQPVVDRETRDAAESDLLGRGGARGQGAPETVFREIPPKTTDGRAIGLVTNVHGTFVIREQVFPSETRTDRYYRVLRRDESDGRETRVGRSEISIIPQLHRAEMGRTQEYDLELDPDLRGAGIGSFLLYCQLRKVIESGVTEMRVYFPRSRLFHAFGFETEEYEEKIGPYVSNVAIGEPGFVERLEDIIARRKHDHGLDYYYAVSETAAADTTEPVRVDTPSEPPVSARAPFEAPTEDALRLPADVLGEALSSEHVADIRAVFDRAIDAVREIRPIAEYSPRAFGRALLTELNKDPRLKIKLFDLASRDDYLLFEKPLWKAGIMSYEELRAATQLVSVANVFHADRASSIVRDEDRWIREIMRGSEASAVVFIDSDHAFMTEMNPYLIVAHEVAEAVCGSLEAIDSQLLHYFGHEHFLVLEFEMALARAFGLLEYQYQYHKELFENWCRQEEVTAETLAFAEGTVFARYDLFIRTLAQSLKSGANEASEDELRAARAGDKRSDDSTVPDSGAAAPREQSGTHKEDGSVPRDCVAAVALAGVCALAIGTAASSLVSVALFAVAGAIAFFDWRVQAPEPGRAEIFHEALLRVRSVETVHKFQNSSRWKGPLEKKKMWFINSAAQTAISSLPFRSTNGFGFNQVRANEAASFLMFASLERFFQRHAFYEGVVDVGEDQRYGVPGLVSQGTRFGQRHRISAGPGDSHMDHFRRFLPFTRTVSLSVDVLEGSSNSVTDTAGCYGTVVACGKKGDLIKNPDSLYYDKRLVGPGLEDLGTVLDPATPVGECMRALSRARKKDPADLRVALLFRDRHIDSDGNGLIRQLIEAGISVETADTTEMRRRVNAEGIYQNGNMYLLSNDFFPIDGLHSGMLDCVLGVGKPTEGENMRIITAITGGQMRGRLASYDALRDGHSAIRLSRDVGKYSPREIGVLRSRGLLEAKHVLAEPRRPRDLAMAVAYAKDSPWDDRIKGIHIDEETGDVSVHVKWYGASGEVELLKVVYESKLPHLQKALAELRLNVQVVDEIAREKALLEEMARLYYDCARIYSQFGYFEVAHIMIKNGARALKDSVQRLRQMRRRGDISQALFASEAARLKGLVDQYDSTRNLYSALKSLVSEPVKNAAIGKGISFLAKAIATGPDNRDAKRLMRRLTNHLADAERIKGEAIDESAAPQSRAKKNLRWQRLITARQRYERVLENFEPEITQEKELFTQYVQSKADHFERLELERDRLEYELVLLQRDLMDHLLSRDDARIEADFRYMQNYYGHLADYYGSIAVLYENYGFHHRAVRYLLQQLQMYEIIGDNAGGIQPLQVIHKLGKNYAQEFMYEPAIAAYARLLNAESAFDVYRAKDEKDRYADTFENFVTGIFFMPFVTAVLPEYVGLTLRVRGAPESAVSLVAARVQMWTENNAEQYRHWALTGALRTDAAGVIWLRDRDGIERELTDVLLERTGYSDTGGMMRAQELGKINLEIAVLTAGVGAVALGATLFSSTPFIVMALGIPAVLIAPLALRFVLLKIARAIVRHEETIVKLERIQKSKAWVEPSMRLHIEVLRGYLKKVDAQRERRAARLRALTERLVALFRPSAPPSTPARAASDESEEEGPRREDRPEHPPALAAAETAIPEPLPDISARPDFQSISALWENRNDADWIEEFFKKKTQKIAGKVKKSPAQPIQNKKKNGISSTRSRKYPSVAVQVDAHIHTAVVQALVHEPEKAAEAITQAVALDPGHPLLPLLEGLVLYAQKDVRSALHSCSELARRAHRAGDTAYVQFLVAVTVEAIIESGKELTWSVSELKKLQEVETDRDMQRDVFGAISRSLRRRLYLLGSSSRDSEKRATVFNAVIALGNQEIAAGRTGILDSERDREDRDLISQAYYDIARTYAERGDAFFMVKEAIEKAIELTPERPEYFAYSTLFYVKQIVRALKKDDISAAAALLGEIVELLKRNHTKTMYIDILFLAGIVSLKVGDAAVLRKNIDTICSSLSAENLLQVASIYRELDSDQLCEALMGLLSDRRYSPEARRGVALLLAHEEKELIEEYMPGLRERIVRFLAKAQYDRAETERGIAEILAPDDPTFQKMYHAIKKARTFTHEADRAYSDGAWAAARHAYEKALYHIPTSEYLTGQIRAIEAAQKDETAFKTKTQSIENLIRIARAYEAEGRFPDAHEKYQMAQRLFVRLDQAPQTFAREQMALTASIQQGLGRTVGKAEELHEEPEKIHIPKRRQKSVTDGSEKSDGPIAQPAPEPMTVRVAFAKKLSGKKPLIKKKTLDRTFRATIASNAFVQLNMSQFPKGTPQLYKLKKGRARLVYTRLSHDRLLILYSDRRGDHTYEQVYSQIRAVLDDLEGEWERATLFGTYDYHVNETHNGAASFTANAPLSFAGPVLSIGAACAALPPLESFAVHLIGLGLSVWTLATHIEWTHAPGGSDPRRKSLADTSSRALALRPADHSAARARFREDYLVAGDGRTKISTVVEVATGRVWETYTYKANGRLASIDLLNAAHGETIRCQVLDGDPDAPESFYTFIIKQRAPGSTTYQAIGEIALENQRFFRRGIEQAAVSINSFKIRALGKRGTGIGRAVFYALALKAAREGKVLRISSITRLSPLYLYMEAYAPDAVRASYDDYVDDHSHGQIIAAGRLGLPARLLAEEELLFLSENGTVSARVRGGRLVGRDVPPDIDYTFIAGHLKIFDALGRLVSVFFKSRRPIYVEGPVDLERIYAAREAGGPTEFGQSGFGTLTALVSLSGAGFGSLSLFSGSWSGLSVAAGLFLSACLIMMASSDRPSDDPDDRAGAKQIGNRRSSKDDRAVPASNVATTAPLMIGTRGALMSGSLFPINEILNSGKILEPHRVEPLIDALIDDPELAVNARAACLLYKNWFDQYCHALSYKAYTSEQLEHDHILSAGEKMKMFIARVEDHFKESRTDQEVLAFLFNELSRRAQAIIAMDPGTVTAREATLLARETIAGMRGALALFQYIIGYEENGTEESRYAMLDGGYFVEGGFVQRSFFQSIDSDTGKDLRLSYTKKETEAVQRVLGVDLKQTDNPYYALGYRGLTKQEEKELFRLYRLENNGLAHWVIVEMTRNYFYHRIKGYVVMQYRNRADLDDIMQQAVEGILTGMQSYKVSKGFYFRSYVWTSIKNKILEYLWSQETTVSVNRDMRQTQHVLTLSKRLFYYENKRWPQSYEELLAFDPSLEITKKQYENVAFADGLTVSSLDEPIAVASERAGKGHHYIDYLPGSSFAREHFELFDAIDTAYALFKDRYFTVQKKNAARNWDMLYRRGIYEFGSDERNPFLRIKEAESLEAIGERYGLSKEGVNKITTPMAAEIKDSVRALAPGLDSAAIDAFFPRASRPAQEYDHIKAAFDEFSERAERQSADAATCMKNARALMRAVAPEQRSVFTRGLARLAAHAEEHMAWQEYEATLALCAPLADSAIGSALIVGAERFYYPHILALMGARVTIVDWSSQRLERVRALAESVRFDVRDLAPEEPGAITYIPEMIQTLDLERFGLVKNSYDMVSYFTGIRNVFTADAAPREWLLKAQTALRSRGFIYCKEEAADSDDSTRVPPQMQRLFQTVAVIGSGISDPAADDGSRLIVYAVSQNMPNGLRAIVDAWEDCGYDASACARYVARHANIFATFVRDGTCRAEQILSWIEKAYTIAESTRDEDMLVRLKAGGVRKDASGNTYIATQDEALSPIEEIRAFAAAEGIDSFQAEEEPRLVDIITRTVGRGRLIDVGCGNNLFVDTLVRRSAVDPDLASSLLSLQGIDQSYINPQVLLAKENFKVTQYEYAGDEIAQGSAPLVLTFNAPYAVDFLAYFGAESSLVPRAGLVFVRLHEVDADLKRYHDVRELLIASGFAHVAIVSDIKGYPQTTDTGTTPIVIAWKDAVTDHKEEVRPRIDNAPARRFARELARTEYDLDLRAHKDLAIIVDYTHVKESAHPETSAALIAEYLRGKNVGDYRVACVVDTDERISDTFVADMNTLLGPERVSIIRRAQEKDFSYYANSIIARSAAAQDMSFVVISNRVQALTDIRQTADLRRVSLAALASDAEYCRLGIVLAFMDSLLDEAVDEHNNVYFEFDPRTVVPAVYDRVLGQTAFADIFIRMLIDEVHAARRQKILRVAA